MAKFVELDYIIEVLNEYPSSNTNKIINTIKEEYIYDEHDVRGPSFKATFLGIYAAFLTILTIYYFNK